MNTIRHLPATAALLLSTLLCSQFARAGEVNAAVAANFTAAAREIAAAFERDTGNQVKLSFGSTGKLYTQIVNGAPFDVFLAADTKRPERLVNEKQASPASRFTYAVGQIVLWSANPKLIDAEGAVLKQHALSRIAIANPKTAPYGAAAVQALQKLGLWQQMQATTVRGENIAQTYQIAKTGAVPAAIVARAQIALDSSGSYWPIPSDLYSPIKQQAVLLVHGQHNDAARQWLRYLKSDTAHKIIARYGYGLE